MRYNPGMSRLSILFLAGAVMLTAQDNRLRVIAFGAHPDDCDGRAAGTRRQICRRRHRCEIRRRSPTATPAIRPRAAARWPSGAGRKRQESGRRLGIDLRRPRQSRRRTAADAGSAAADHPENPPMERGHRAGPAAQRLPPRPSLHGRAGAGCRLHGGGAERLPGYAAAAEEPRLPVLRGSLPEDRRLSGPTSRSTSTTCGEEGGCARRARVAGLRVAAVGGRKARQVPKDPAQRKVWLSKTRAGRITPGVRKALEARYGAEAGKIAHVEAFELCEYGRQPSREELSRMFPK